MKKSVVQETTTERARVAGSLSKSTTQVRPNHKAPPQVPRWVKTLVIVAIALIVLALILRVTLMPYLHSLFGGHSGFDGQVPFVSLLIHGGPLV